MVRNYKRKKECTQLSSEDIKNAVDAVNGGQKCKAVADSFGIPRSTLQRSQRIFQRA